MQNLLKKLEGKSVRDRCVALDRFFNAVLEEKGNRNEFIQEFPTIVEDIFVSSKDKRAWILSQLREDYEALVEMLKPESRFFQLLFKFGSNPAYRYEFPMTRLPESYKYMFTSGVKLPPFFVGRVNLLKKSVTLNILEYYVFIFCYAVTIPLHDELAEEERQRAREEVHNSPSVLDKFYAPKKSEERKYKSDNCYLHLLEQYLDLMTKHNNDPNLPKIATYTGHFDSQAFRTAYIEAMTIFWLGQNTPERAAKEIFVPPTDTVITFLIVTIEKIVNHNLLTAGYRSIRFFHVRKGAPLYGPQDEILYGLMLTLAKPFYNFLKICFQRANRMPDKLDYSGLIQIWSWYLRPFYGVTDFTRQVTESTPSKPWSKMKHLFAKDAPEQETTTPAYPPEIQSVLDAVNYRVVRQHVFQHVPFYTNLLYEFLIHAQNHAKLENDRKDILDVFRCIEPSPANRIIEYLHLALRVLSPSTPIHGAQPALVDPEEAAAIRTRTALLESENADCSLERCKEQAIKLISVIKSVKATKPSAEDIIGVICNVFDIKDGGKWIPVYGQAVSRKTDGEGSAIDYSKCYDNNGELTEYGRSLVRRGLLQRSIDEIGHRGDRPRPVKSDEILVLVRLAYFLSELIYKWTGQRYDLRFLGNRQVLALFFVAFMICSFFALLMYLVISASTSPTPYTHIRRPQ